MNWVKLLILLIPLAYIVFWFYELFTTIAGWLGITLGHALDLTLWQVVGLILFFTGGLVLLGVSIVGFFLILFDEW